MLVVGEEPECEVLVAMVVCVVVALVGVVIGATLQRVLAFALYKRDRLTERSLMPQASSPSSVEGVRVIDCSVGVGSPRSITTPVQTAPGVAVAWQPYWFSLHMKEKTPPVTLELCELPEFVLAVDGRQISGSMSLCSPAGPGSRGQQSHKQECNQKDSYHRSYTARLL